MFILQRIFWLPPLKSQVRLYAQKTKKPKVDMAGNMVHQEMLRYVNPFARVNVQSDLFVRVAPADVHQYTSGDVFIAQLRGDAAKNCNATLEITICDDDKVVNVLVKKLATQQPASFECDLKIPVRADLYIQSCDNVLVEGVQSEALQIRAAGGIQTKNVKATNISLYSEKGNIVCGGTLLGKCTEIETHNGNIVLDKLQGDSLKASTKGGSINTDCCYVENSKFQTETGRLELKNVHKSSEVLVLKSGDLKMTGVHGNLNVVAKGGSINLQLSELVGKSQIVAQNLDNEAIINISEAIEQNINIDVRASEVNLDNALEHVAHALSKDKSQFMLSSESQTQHHLVVSSTGGKGVRLGKQSWTDMMRQTINNVD